MTFNDLMQQALLIFNAKLRKENTAKRVGGLFRDILNYFKELIDTKASKEDLANATDKFKGYHASLAELQAAYPQAQNLKDFSAWVGANYPGTVYKVNADKGAWMDTGKVPPLPQVDLSLYIKKDDLKQTTGSTLTIPMSQDAVTKELCQRIVMLKSGDAISQDGVYLMVEDGIITTIGFSVNVPASDVSIRGFVAPNGTFNYNTQYDTYSRTDKKNIPAGAISVNVKSLSGTSTTPIAFYNASGTFISSVTSTSAGSVITVSIPANATQYALTKHDTLEYSCAFLTADSAVNTIENKNAITLIEKKGESVQTSIIRHLPVLPDKLLQVVRDRDTLKDDGKYLFVEDGTVLTGNSSTEELPVAESNVNIAGFISLPDGIFGTNTAYSRTNKTAVPTGYKNVRVASLAGTGATPIAFYNSSGTFISSVANTFGGDIIEVPIPANATQYALTKRTDGAIVGYVFECTFFNVSSIENKNAITLIEKKGDVFKTTVLRDFIPSQVQAVIDEKAIRKSTITDMTLTGGSQVTSGYQVTASNVAVPRQIYHPVYTTIERMLFDVSFTVLSDNAVIQIGKGYCYTEISGNKMSIYKINDTLTGSALIETITLPFSLNNAVKYNLRLQKTDGLNLKYTITSAENEFEKLYTVDNTTSLNVVRAWGNAFFGVKNGTVVVNSTTIATGYDEQTQVSFWGDSFLDAGNLLGNGGKWTDRYCDLVARKIGYRKTPIMARTGHALDTAFVARFKAENSYFKSKYVFLAMGTNNTNVSGYTTYVQQCIAEAKANNQIPILVTITPRVGVNYEAVTKAMNDWIKASGEKYVDICAAVTDSNGTWKPQYLTSDGVHPTVAGELAMFRQIMIDVPELFC